MTSKREKRQLVAARLPRPLIADAVGRVGSITLALEMALRDWLARPLTDEQILVAGWNKLKQHERQRTVCPACGPTAELCEHVPTSKDLL